MTKAKPLPKIAAGGRIRTIWSTNSYYVENKAGWFGPTRITKRGAILAWNRVMGEDAYATRVLLCTRLLEANRYRGIDGIFDEIDKIRRDE